MKPYKLTDDDVEILNTNKGLRALFYGAGYGSRTRLLGLGSRCTTDVLIPRKLCYYTMQIRLNQLFLCDFIS